MELTGFKQKSSLRKARNELVELGLISITLGNGRKNTIYHFRFDWITPRGAQKYPSESRNPTPIEGINSAPMGDMEVATPGHSIIPPYNQIQISINNNPVPSTNSNHQEMHKDPFAELKKQFGEKKRTISHFRSSIGRTADNSRYNLQNSDWFYQTNPTIGGRYFSRTRK